MTDDLEFDIAGDGWDTGMDIGYGHDSLPSHDDTFTTHANNGWEAHWGPPYEQEGVKKDDTYQPLTIGTIVEKTVQARDPRRVSRKRKRDRGAADPQVPEADSALDPPSPGLPDSFQNQKEPVSDDDLEDLYGYKEGDVLPGSTAPLNYKRDNSRPSPWTDRETQRFYRALSMFKLSFSLIANLFPGRETREIRAKYKRELVMNESKVLAAVNKNRPIDEERYREYKKASENIRKLKQGDGNISQNDTEGLNPLKEFDSFECLHINPNDSFLPGLTDPEEADVTSADDSGPRNPLETHDFPAADNDLADVVHQTSTTMPVTSFGQ